MTRNPLILAFLAMTLLLGGCSNRSIGNKIDDQFLEPKVAGQIQTAHADLTSPTSHIVVTSYNGVILLAGQTPRPELRDQAEVAARRVVGVKKVHNEIQVQAPSSGMARTNDALLTTRIKTRMLASTGVPFADIKVVTENGIVYLLGLVTREEANQATAAIQKVSGVQRIVRLFQYTD
ncbi:MULTISPECIES: BON domain-containing protein [Pseudomonas]|jgi:osmotically-inducible protein OsmY|uniref:BON domain-containing protein n=1 Tax=Serpens gallinarum TaxID=2763075 RepID=A0ABR8TLG5_9PSED|nr:MULTISPECIES: BON domain-containing protein [Pseudomonas]MBD7976109.1 BON domain-containing protein [Serpens gallinarum]MBF0675442.1 BON domain-containing protein [Pseudomonas sp.]